MGVAAGTGFGAATGVSLAAAAVIGQRVRERRAGR